MITICANTLFLIFLISIGISKVNSLDFNSFRSPQILNSTNICESRGPNCQVQIDVPQLCVNLNDKTSNCPIIFFFHDERMTHQTFRQTSGVHDENMIGVYPRSDCIGWNTKPLSCNLCAPQNFTCVTDVNDVMFVSVIIQELRRLGAFGNIYATGATNGASLAQKIAVNAGMYLPIKGIIALSMPLLKTPLRSGPGNDNYNQPRAGNPAVSILSVHGTMDRVIAYGGGYSANYFNNDNTFTFMSNEESNIAWAVHNGCDPMNPVILPLESNQGSQANLFQFQDCNENVIVEHYQIIGGGHFPGRAILNGSSIQDIGFQFIRRLEGTYGGGSFSPTISPSPTMPFVCENDDSWYFLNSTFDCDFVAERPNTRCVLVNLNGRSAREACPVACDERCEDPFETFEDIVLFFANMIISFLFDFLQSSMQSAKLLIPKIYQY